MFTIPTTFRIAHARVRMLHSWGTGRSICDLSRIIATRQLDAFTVLSSHYVSHNFIYVRSHLFASTDSIAIDLMTMEDWLFLSIGLHQSCHFFLLAILFYGGLRNDFSIPRVPENISHKKHHYNLFPHLDVMEPYLWTIQGLSRYFNKILIYGRQRRHRHLISPNQHGCTSPMHGTLWNAIFTSLIG